MIRLLLAALALAGGGAAVAQDAAPSSVQIAPTLLVRDLARSTRFYAAFGLSAGMTIDRGKQNEVMLVAGPQAQWPTLILLGDKVPSGTPAVGAGGGALQMSARVSDLAAIAAQLKAAGFAVGAAQAAGRGPRVLKVSDPDGNVVELVEEAPRHG